MEIYREDFDITGCTVLMSPEKEVCIVYEQKVDPQGVFIALEKGVWRFKFHCQGAMEKSWIEWDFFEKEYQYLTQEMRYEFKEEIPPWSCMKSNLKYQLKFNHL